jgi:phosphoglycolate phosphatase
MSNVYKHIVWDWNGTLFNDIELCVNIINSVLTRRNLKALSIAEYRDIFTFPVQNYYAKAGLDFTKYSFSELGKEWMDEYHERRLESKLFDKAEEILRKIYDQGIEQSILSAYKQDTLLELVNHFNLRQYFTHLTGLDHIYATSKVDLGKELMEKLNHEKGEVLLIGDTVHDFDVSQEIGADCVLIAEGHQSKERLLECGVNVYDNFDELIRKSTISSKGFII